MVKSFRINIIANLFLFDKFFTFEFLDFIFDCFIVNYNIKHKWVTNSVGLAPMYLQNKISKTWRHLKLLKPNQQYSLKIENLRQRLNKNIKPELISSLLSLLGSCTKVSGMGFLNMVMEYKFGLTVPDMKVSGLKVKHVEKEPSDMLMGIFMKEIGKMIKPMDMEPTPIAMEQNIKVTGKMIFNGEMEPKFGLMEAHMMASIKMAKSMDLENTNGQMEVLMREAGMRTELKGTENIVGQMEEYMMENG